MKKSPLFALLLGVGLAAPQLSRAELLLYYNFENRSTGTVTTNNTSIDNIVAGRPDGILRLGTAGGTVEFTLGGTVAGGNLGRSLRLTPAAIGNGNLEAPNIDTNFTAVQLSITPSTAYTAMAWVNFADISGTSGDNIIFGQAQSVADQPVLHHGARNADYHSGHWADDFTAGGTAPDPQAGVWHHVAYTNNTAGLQEIFVDGVSIGSAGGATPPTTGGMNTALNVLIGTSANGGSFTGQLDEIKIYNEVLSAAQIQQASVVIPEPGTAGLLALGAGALGLMARRRRA